LAVAKRPGVLKQPGTKLGKECPIRVVLHLDSHVTQGDVVAMLSKKATAITTEPAL